MKNVKLSVCLDIDTSSIEIYKKFAHHGYLFNLDRYPEIIKVSNVETKEIPTNIVFSIILKTDMFLVVKDNAEDLLKKFTNHIEYLIDLDNYPSISKVLGINYQFVD